MTALLAMVACDHRPASPEPDSGVDAAGTLDASVLDATPDDGGTTAPWCGDEMCNGTEDCAVCPADCGYCEPGPCSHPGGRSCGQNGIEGDPETLYLCDGAQWVVDHPCGEPCETMPSGVPDRCPSDLTVPQSLVDVVDAVPYVEQSCVSGSYAGWPYDARECTYSAGGLTATVTVANPDPARVASWIVDSSTFVPTLWNLKWESPADYEDGLAIIGTAMMLQSSRIFPLHGGILENMGNGWYEYPFDKGVTEGCSSGCYCRINSLHRTEWCGYQEFLGIQPADDCLTQIGTSGLTAAWGQQCLQNHIDAWTSDRNEHFRAKAWQANQAVKSSCPSYSSCTPTQVLNAVDQAFN